MKQLLSFSVRCCKLLIFPVLLFKGLRAENESSLTCLELNIFIFLQPSQMNDSNFGLEGITLSLETGLPLQEAQAKPRCRFLHPEMPLPSSGELGRRQRK